MEIIFRQRDRVVHFIGDAAMDQLISGKDGDDGLGHLTGEAEIDAAVLRVGCDLEVLDRIFGETFHPYGAIDTAGGCIPHAAVFQNLLAIGIDALIRGVFDFDKQFVFFLDGVCDIQRERGIAAFMVADVQAVEKHFAFLVDGFEVEHDPTLRVDGIGEAAPAPENLMGQQPVVAAGQQAAQGKGDEDGFPAGFEGRLLIFFGDLIFPWAVEVEPVVPYEHGAWIFRKDVLIVQLFSKTCERSHWLSPFP